MKQIQTKKLNLKIQKSLDYYAKLISMEKIEIVAFDKNMDFMRISVLRKDFWTGEEVNKIIVSLDTWIEICILGEKGRIGYTLLGGNL